MKKRILIFLLLVICGTLAVAHSSGKNTIGFEFGTGILNPIYHYDMKADNAFGLVLNITDDVTVTVMREDARIRGENTYTVIGGVEYKIVNDGTVSITGLRIMHVLPLSFLEGVELGIDIGSARFNTNLRYSTSNGSATNAADWNIVAGDALAGSHPLLGLAVKLNILSSQSKSMDTNLFICSSARFVDIPDTYTLGRNEVNSVFSPAIKPVDNFHNFNVIVGAKIGF